MTQESRKPGPDSPAPEMISKTIANNTKSTTTKSHPAIDAVDARPWFARLAWDEGFRVKAASGKPFTVDEMQAELDLPDLGNGCGGAAMAAHRAGVIRRVGWRASTRASRRGSIITIWIGVDSSASKEAA